MEKTSGRPRHLLSLLALPIALGLSACGGRLGEGEVSEGERRFTEKLLFPTQQLPEKTPFNQAESGCPAVTQNEGTAVWRMGGDSARGLSYQASVSETARECTREGNTLRIKVGVRGRVVMGESGRGGSVTVPVRIVVRDGEKTVLNRLVQANVSVPDGGSVPYSVADEGIALAVTATDPAEQYSILVGIDPQGARASGARRERRR